MNQYLESHNQKSKIYQQCIAGLKYSHLTETSAFHGHATIKYDAVGDNATESREDADASGKS